MSLPRTPTEINRPGLAPALPSRAIVYQFSLRKRLIVRRFVKGVRLTYSNKIQHFPAETALLLWGSEPKPLGLPADVLVVRIEDGFLRSVGLGADLVTPISWVIDKRGIYYDATCASDLEQLLLTTDFIPDLLQRASKLRTRIVNSGLTKYNVGKSNWMRPDANRVILVPGQVESDASLRFGAPGIRTNIGLLQAVRQANPDAYVVYKPHPDVIAGLRASGQGENEARRWSDEVVTETAMHELLDAVDEVHVLTSLAGFEALMRGKKVCCYGQPFYAGWGLTQDVVPVARRTRKLSLDELVAGTLILYPTYVSRVTRQFITPEAALDELLEWREKEVNHMPWWRKGLRLVLRIWGAKR